LPNKIRPNTQKRGAIFVGEQGAEAMMRAKRLPHSEVTEEPEIINGGFAITQS
jgi:hypothetical protein